MGKAETEDTLSRLRRDVIVEWGARWAAASADIANTDQRTVMLMLLCAIHPNISGHRLNEFGETARVDKDGFLWTKLTRRGVTAAGDVRIMHVDKLNSLLGQMIEAIQCTDAERLEIKNRVQGWIVRDERAVAEHVERMRSEMDKAGDGITLADFDKEDFK